MKWASCRIPAQSHKEKGPDGRVWHIDHLYPEALGGDWKNDNLVLACATCNLRKSRHLLMDFLKLSLLK